MCAESNEKDIKWSTVRHSGALCVLALAFVDHARQRVVSFEKCVD